MKRIVLFLFALALVISPRCIFAGDDEGLHLGGLDKDTKKAKIEAKKVGHKSKKDAEKARKKAKKEADKRNKEAKKALKKSEKDSEMKKNEHKRDAEKNRELDKLEE